MSVAGGVARSALSLACLAALGCTGSPPASRYDDAFAYCAAVRDIDAPDDRYTGPEPPPGTLAALGLRRSDPPRTTWRCMGGSVYACSFGANIPCREKVDLSRTPSPGVLTWCAEHPDADFVPLSASGRATVHAWKCTAGEPEIAGTFGAADARGFIAGVWTEVAPRP